MSNLKMFHMKLLVNKFTISAVLIIIFPLQVFSKGKIYGKSKTISKEYIKYENCRLRQTLVNMKDGQKDGYKCIYKRQGKGKDITVFQPSPICQKSFKCKMEEQ